MIGDHPGRVYARILHPIRLALGALFDEPDGSDALTIGDVLEYAAKHNHALRDLMVAEGQRRDRLENEDP